MRSMRIVLASVYIILIILILLTHCGDKSHPVEPVDHEEQAVHADAEEEDRIAEIGGSGDMKVTLLWDFYGDIDLHVEEPGGDHIFYRNTRSSNGGMLDRDNTAGGRGSAENIYWVNPPAGQYKVWIEYFACQSNHTTGGPCEVYVKLKGQPAKKFVVELSREKQAKNVTVINL